MHGLPVIQPDDGHRVLEISIFVEWREAVGSDIAAPGDRLAFGTIFVRVDLHYSGRRAVLQEVLNDLSTIWECL